MLKYVVGSRDLVRLLALAIVALSFVAPGCGPGPSNVPNDDAGENLRNFARYYNQYTGRNRGRAPRDEKSFAKFLSTLVDKPDPKKLLVSPRDNQPYVIIWGKSWAGGSENVPIIAYEQQGADGVRYIARAHGGVEEVTDEEFEKLNLQ